MTKVYTSEDLEKKFEDEGCVIQAIPTDMKRIIIPVYGFSGGEKAIRTDWGPDGEFREEVTGVVFKNPKDEADQVLKQSNGCLICYDGSGRQEKIERYLKENPEALKTADGIRKLIGSMKVIVADSNGKPDLWDTDVPFAKSLMDAPEEIKLGQVFSAVKKKEAVTALRFNQGEQFQGPTGTPQIAGENGAYIVRDAAGLRMVQAEEFKKAYETTRDPEQEKKMSKELLGTPINSVDVKKYIEHRGFYGTHTTVVTFLDDKGEKLARTLEDFTDNTGYNVEQISFKDKNRGNVLVNRKGLKNKGETTLEFFSCTDEEQSDGIQGWNSFDPTEEEEKELLAKVNAITDAAKAEVKERGSIPIIPIDKLSRDPEQEKKLSPEYLSSLSQKTKVIELDKYNKEVDLSTFSKKEQQSAYIVRTENNEDYLVSSNKETADDGYKGPERDYANYSIRLLEGGKISEDSVSLTLNAPKFTNMAGNDSKKYLIKNNNPEQAQQIFNNFIVVDPVHKQYLSDTGVMRSSCVEEYQSSLKGKINGAMSNVKNIINPGRT